MELFAIPIAHALPSSQLSTDSTLVDCYPVLIPTVAGHSAPATGVVDASHMVMLTPRATFIDCAKRNLVPPSKKALRFCLFLGSAPNEKSIEIRKSAPETHDGAVARLLLSIVADQQPDWCPLWEKAPIHADKVAWRQWVNRYMDQVPSDWGWRSAMRASNLASAWDHGTANWCGSLGSELYKTGFIIKRGLLNTQQVSLLLTYHRKWHTAGTGGVGLHVLTGIRGCQVYVHPDVPSEDPFLRPDGGFKQIGEDNKHLKEWHCVLKTLKDAAGRKEWPMDIDALANWPGSTPQENHQDGTFSMLACTVALQSNTPCTMFGNYVGANVMSMESQRRVDWIHEKFVHCADKKNMHKMPTLFAGDVVFFHTSHIHRGPSMIPTRGTRSATQPRRTFFFGFDSDSKTCEADVVTIQNCKEHWGALKAGQAQKARRKRRKEAKDEKKKEKRSRP